MIEVAVGSLPSDTSLDERAVRDMTESETDCSEVLDEVVLGRIASLPLEPFPPRDFRGKFKKMRHKKRPTILESRCHFDSTQLRRSPREFFSFPKMCPLMKERFFAFPICVFASRASDGCSTKVLIYLSQALGGGGG